MAQQQKPPTWKQMDDKHYNEMINGDELKSSIDFKKTNISNIYNGKRISPLLMDECALYNTKPKNMIHGNELRAGNWIIKTNKLIGKIYQEPEQVFLIEEMVVGYKINGSLEENIFPIPLSEDVLLKCGFKKGEFTYDFDKLSIHLPSNEYKNGRTYYNSWCIIEGVPNSLHSLQNLIHSIDGKEIEYAP